jgi:hypothetical protein
MAAPGTPQNPIINSDTQPTSEVTVLGSSGYDMNFLRYPDEVGSPDVPSYVVFNIYVPASVQYDTKSNPSLQSVQSRSQNNSDYLASTAGKPQNLGASQTGVGVVAGLSAAKAGFSASDGGPLSAAGAATGAGLATTATAELVSAAGQNLISLKPKLRRINQSVAIYMPDTVMTSFNHDYGTVSATEAMGNLGLATAAGNAIKDSFSSFWNALKNTSLSDVAHPETYASGIFKQLGAGASNLANSPAGREVLGTLAQASGLVGSGFTELALRSAGVAVNPQVELLYRGTQNRSFIFEFRFQPRSQKEAKNIKKIIQTFKYFSSPSIQTNTNGRYFIVPGQFDITFKFQNTDNPYISQISTCVLEAVDVNYSGAGQFATFVDGSPVEITMQLRFKEAEIMYRELMWNPVTGDKNQGF